jgi:hypothetical protein
VSWGGALVDDVVVVAMVDQQHPSRAHALLKILQRFPENNPIMVVFYVWYICVRVFLLDVVNRAGEMSKRVAEAHDRVELQTLDVFSQGQPVGLLNH